MSIDPELFFKQPIEVPKDRKKVCKESEKTLKKAREVGVYRDTLESMESYFRKNGELTLKQRRYLQRLITQRWDTSQGIYWDDTYWPDKFDRGGASNDYYGDLY